ncbi:hypothetical protein [Streptomyces sp. NRRL F-5122]|uniref:hypothetical protein n=1 Tax=Streptomyces sp. NRRL F-5122 TaxID=1609098 RepID=UPI00131CB119|nr:hypothetical protein [Streptomyces sp. NRRL F-5122]
MSVATVVLDYLKTLIWPIVLLVFIVRFSPTLRQVLENLSELSGPAGITARFERDINRTAAQADLAASVEQGQSRAGNESPIGDTSENLLASRIGLTCEDVLTWASIARSMARVRPQAMISESWGKLEDVVLRAANSLGLNHYTQASDPSDFVALLGQLTERGLSPEFFRVGVNLAVLQSQINVLNSQRSRPAPSAAEDFVSASERLMIAILRLPVETSE